MPVLLERLELHQKLLDGLEALRNLAAVPVIIHAGYRCPQHNLEGAVSPEASTRAEWRPISICPA
jgi:hypothetical protein